MKALPLLLLLLASGAHADERDPGRLTMHNVGVWDADSIARRQVVWVERADTVRLVTWAERIDMKPAQWRALFEWVHGERRPLFYSERLSLNGGPDSLYLFIPVRRIRFGTSNGDVYLIEERPGARARRVSSLWRWR